MEKINVNDYSSVIAKKPYSGVSNKYAFISTKQVVDEFAKRGWAPTFIKESRAYTPLRVGYQKHIVRFREEGKKLVKGELIPEIAFGNSHDTSTKARMCMAYFLVKCENGLIVPDSLIDDLDLSIRHVGDVTSKVKLAIEAVNEYSNPIRKEIKRYKELSFPFGKFDNDGVEFAKEAIDIRYPGNADRARRVSPIELLRPVRKSDEGNSLWKVFNVIQEKFQKGTYHVFKTKEEADVMDEEALRRARMSKPLKDVKEIVRVNMGLWELMHEYSLS
jgi:hypothetical protein